MEILRVGVDGDKIHAPDLGVNHVIDGVFARAAHSHDPNPCERLYLRLYLWHE